MKTLAKPSSKLGLNFLVAATRLYACAPKMGIKNSEQHIKQQTEHKV